MPRFNKKNLAIVIGNALEYYDFMLYGFFAAILAPLFFPSDTPGISLIISMATYGVGFLARPLGGIVFGHLGDRQGRKNTLSLSILLLTLPTLGIALLPTYAQIGMWAPLLLVFFRLLQGFCLGGETSGAVTYFLESSPPHERDIMSGWLVASAYVGTLLGTLLGSFFTLSMMPSWGWRLTFVIGALIAFIGYYIRKNLKETPEFIDNQKRGKILKLPLKELLKTKKMYLFYAAGISSAVIVPFMTIFIHLNTLFTKNLHLDPSLVLFLNSGLMVFWIIFMPIFGHLAQKYGRRLIMSFGLVGMGSLAYPLFLLMGPEPTLEGILLTQFVLSFFAIAYGAPTASLLIEFFPTNERYSGIAAGYSLGHAIFGGLTPMLFALLVQSYGFIYAPAAGIILCCMLGLFALYKSANRQESLHQEFAGA